VNQTQEGGEMKLYTKELSVIDGPLIVGFDVEWTKNYQQKRANRAFCFSLVWVRAEQPEDISTLERTLAFGFISGYAEAEAECQDLCLHANRCVDQVLASTNVIVGHQFSSDLSVLLACSEERLPAVERLQQAWHTRRHPLAERAVGVFDTRYDLPISNGAASNKLVHVCPAWNLLVTQPEIKGSMTKMQRDFYQNHAVLTREKIAVLNLRHSLSSVLLYLFHRDARPTRPVNINIILYHNLSEQFDYVRSDHFGSLLLEGSADADAVGAPMCAQGAAT
jgi:hypothetical protein